MAVYGTVRSTAPSDLLRTIRFPGSRLSSASTSRLFDPSKMSVLISPKFSVGAEAAADGAGAAGAVGAAGAAAPRAAPVGAVGLFVLVVPRATVAVGAAPEEDVDGAAGFAGPVAEAVDGGVGVVSAGAGAGTAGDA